MNSPRIREVMNHGKPQWLVDIPASMTAKRKRLFFATQDEAEKYVRKAYANSKDVGFRSAFIPPDRMEKLLRLGRWLEENGIDPASVPAALAKRPSGRLSVTAGKAAEQFVQAKASKGCRQRYLAKLERTMRLFLPNRRDLPIAELGTDAVEEFLGRNGYRPATRKSYRSDLGSFFSWCVRKGYRDDNPVHSTEAPILDDKAPGILTASEVRDLLDATQRHSPRLVPWVCLVVFGGLRPDEARRIAWEDIREGFVHIEGVKAKTRRRRLVPISDQLAAWLDAARAVEAPLPPVGWDRDWRRARDKAGLKERYSHNALRHSFASYHFALHRRASETAAIMGHSEAMLFRHYRERVNPREAEAFFGLLPNPDALAAGMAEHRRPKHVPPHLLRRRRLEAASGIPQVSTQEAQAAGKDPESPSTPVQGPSPALSPSLPILEAWVKPQP